MARLADGDRSAFAPVFEALWPVLRAFAARAVGAHDGEDAAQAALVRVFERACEYDPARPALPWAIGIAAWECRTVLRRRSRRREDPVAGAPDRAGDGTPEDAVIDADLRAAAREVIGTLRPLDAETLDALWTGHRRTAGATFRKRLERAIARFRTAWRARHGAE